MPDKIPVLTDLSRDDLRGLVVELGGQAYRADQIVRWIYQDFAWTFDDMVNVPLSLRTKLAERANLHSLNQVQELTSRDGSVKALFELADGQTIESTLMPNPGGRNTVCVSTQVGCPVGCPFCATGQQGFERNLTPGEIIDQVLYFARQLKLKTKPGVNPGAVTNIVFMGMGEPLANFTNLWRAIVRLNAPDGFGLAARSMTISTSGAVPQMKFLAKQGLQVGLAVSLHAPDNVLRNKLVPLNRKHSIEEVLAACKEYFEVTGRRVSFEYILFEGINDSRRHGEELGKLLKGMECHVNLILANPTGLARFKPPARETVVAFENQVKHAGVACTLRRGRGEDINGGCGQLRSRVGKITKPEPGKAAGEPEPPSHGHKPQKKPDRAVHKPTLQHPK